MKRHRQPRQMGITSTTKIKKLGNRYYGGGSDPNKGRKKKSWYEFFCSLCNKINKISPGYPAKCSCKKSGVVKDG